MNFTLKQLQAFVAVVNYGSTLAASENLKISQPAISSAISDFEKKIGAKLFHRWKKRMVLNETGRTVVPMARLLLANADDLNQMFGGESGQLGGSLRLGVSTTASYFIPEILTAFAEQYPQVKIKVICRNKTAIINQIEDFSLDIGIIAGTSNRSNIQIMPWMMDELCIFTAASNPFITANELTLADIKAGHWILREEGSGTLEVFLNAIPVEVKPLKTVMEFNNLEAIKSAVEHGGSLGYMGCISKHAVKRELEAGIFQELKAPFLDLRRQYSFLVHRERHQSHLLSSLLAHCYESNGLPGEVTIKK